MKKEDYNKFYIQGSDHYLIPKYEFIELFNEMENWKEEAKELKKQLTTYQILHRDCKVDNLKNISKIEEKENQQKEFIEWLENGINQVRNTEFLDERIQRAGLVAYNRVLSKYKEIIGGKDEIIKK